MGKKIRGDVGYVHVHGTKGTHVIEPGGEIPDDVDADELDQTLFEQPEDEEPKPVPGFGQTETHLRVAREREEAAKKAAKQEKGGDDDDSDPLTKLTVPELRDRLAAKGIAFSNDDRKSELAAKAKEAGIDG